MRLRNFLILFILTLITIHNCIKSGNASDYNGGQYPPEEYYNGGYPSKSGIKSLEPEKKYSALYHFNVLEKTVEIFRNNIIEYFILPINDSTSLKLSTVPTVAQAGEINTQLQRLYAILTRQHQTFFDFHKNYDQSLLESYTVQALSFETQLQQFNMALNGLEKEIPQELAFKNLEAEMKETKSLINKYFEGI